jgi:hypothetical protein
MSAITELAEVLPPLVRCPLCGGRKGYSLYEGSTYRYWRLACKACGDEVGECPAQRIPYDTPRPARWGPADEHWNSVGAYADGLRQALVALLPVLEQSGCSLDASAQEALDKAKLLLRQGED